MGIAVALLLGIIVWQQIQLNILHRQGRQPGRIITLSANMPVLDVIEGSNVFTIPKGSRIQETTPRGFTAPSERGGEEYVIVLRTNGGPRGPALLEPPRSWMDDYRVERPDHK